MAKLDSLERQMQQAMRSKIIAENAEAAKKLEPELKAAREAQELLINDATKLKDARERTGKEGQGLWARLAKVAHKGVSEGIPGFIIVSLVETTLGNVDEIDKRARATVKAYRSTLGNELNALMDAEGWKAARIEVGVKEDVSDSDLGYNTVRKVIAAQTKGAERIAYEATLSQFTKAVREASRNKAKVKESNEPALVAVSYKELTEFLTQCTEMVPARQVKGERADLDLEADTESEAEEMTQAAVNQ